MLLMPLQIAQRCHLEWLTNSVFWGIHLTKPLPTCSVVRYAGLSQDTRRVRSRLCDGRDVSKLPCTAAVAGGFLLSSVWTYESLRDRSDAVPVFGVSLPSICHRRNDLSGHPQTPDNVVSGLLLGGGPEERCQRAGPETDTRTRELSDGVGLVAQDAHGHGPPWA